MKSDGMHLASASLDYTVHIWNVPTGKTEHILHGHISGYCLLPTVTMAKNQAARKILQCEFGTQKPGND